ncbi:beta strand repeat-containing protein [Nocardioides sp. URHA0032]|uniref:beta strand repeat-containing protein n=1 Tax=Nocardioides sp. URHA0032 TaxID=1380388 RepID=UPI00048CDD59|nr:hypothetical protein [Nocardioides sp. URHA0032]
MNSSGIKRGLAGSAVAALAVTGLPFFASSANAATGDVLQVQSASTTRNGGSEGATIVLNTKNVDQTKLQLAGTDLVVGHEDNSTQTVDIFGTTTIVTSGATGDSTPNDGLDQITLHVKVTTPPGGDNTADFVIFEDEANLGTVDATEARTQTSVKTTGEVASIDVAPASQSAASGQSTGDYTVTIKDANGDLTQLTDAETLTIASNGDATFGKDGDGNAIDASEISDGTAVFTATGTATGSQTITVSGNGKSDTAVLNVTAAAGITADEVDIVTAADSWNGFGNPDDTDGNANVTLVRVDQSSVRIDFKSDDTSDRNATVTLNVHGNGVTFGGEADTTVTTVLDSNGAGSVTITPDALSVQDGDSINIGGSFSQTLDFVRAEATFIDAAQDPYFGKLKGSVDVKVTVTDQFNNPVTSGFIGAQRVAGPNHVGDPQQAKPVDSTGSATFTFTDAKATNGEEDTVGFGYVPDQFTLPADADPTGSTQIKWTTDGMGANFTTNIDGTSTESPTYDPSEHSVVPLADAKVNGSSDSIPLTVTGAEDGSTVTISVDNGALILPSGSNDLSDGKSSITVNLASGDTDVTGYKLVGTKSGLTTVTTTAAGRTETAQFTVAAETDSNTARNVTVSGPASVDHGTTQIPFTAVVTDAFGNPVAGVSVYDLNIQVTGPAQFQDSDAMTDANGQLHLNVRVDAGAEGDVTIKVQGLNDQFGAAADQLYSWSPANSAKGLPASSNVSSATTTVEGAVVVKEDAGLKVIASSKGQKDKVTANAISDAAGATATLWVGGKKVATKTLGSSGNAKFSVKDKNGNKKSTKYTVKITGTSLTKKDKASDSVK